MFHLKVFGIALKILQLLTHVLRRMCVGMRKISNSTLYLALKIKHLLTHLHERRYGK